MMAMNPSEYKIQTKYGDIRKKFEMRHYWATWQCHDGTDRISDFSIGNYPLKTYWEWRQGDDSYSSEIRTF